MLACLHEFSPPSSFAQLMERSDVLVDSRYRNKSIMRHIMDRYEHFKDKNFLRKEEFREKMMALCRNEHFNLNKDESRMTFLKWAII